MNKTDTRAPAPEQLPALLTLRQAAAYLSVSEQSARHLVREGLLPVIKMGGKPRSRIRVARRDLDRLVAASRTPATSGPLARTP